jgi:hypothetical protein
MYHVYIQDSGFLPYQAISPYYEIVLAIEVHTIIQIWTSVQLGSMTAAKMPIVSTLKGATTALVMMDSLAME